MTKEELVARTKSWCEAEKLLFVDDVTVGQDTLLLVMGKDAATKLDGFLDGHSLKHTTSMIIADAIGSYVTL